MSEEIAYNDINWTDEPIIGWALLIKGGSIDSGGDQIERFKFYQVGKHKQTGKVAIVPTGAGSMNHMRQRQN